jgi:hypothetical protein
VKDQLQGVHQASLPRVVAPNDHREVLKMRFEVDKTPVVVYVDLG